MPRSIRKTGVMSRDKIFALLIVLPLMNISAIGGSVGPKGSSAEQGGEKIYYGAGNGTTTFNVSDLSPNYIIKI